MGWEIDQDTALRPTKNTDLRTDLLILGWFVIGFFDEAV